MTAQLDIAMPRHWSWSPLKFSTTLLNRGTAPDYVENGPVRVLSQAANQAGGLDWDRTRFHDYGGNPKKLKGYLHSGDVLINSTGTGTLGRVGYFAAGPDDRPCIADGHITVIRADRQIADPRYQYYWLSSSLFYGYIYSALTVGATNQIELNRERLAAAPIALPSLDEQRGIADFLDAETAQVDRLVRQRADQVAALNEMVLSAIDDALRPVRDCPFVRLGYLALVQTGVTVDSNRSLDGETLTVPYLRVANVQAGHVDLSDIAEITVSRTAAATSRLRMGDVLMTEGGDLDKLGRGTVWNSEIEPCLHQNHVFAVRPDPDKLVPEYLAVLTRASMARRYFESTGNRTTNLASTSSSKIRDFRVPLARLETQRIIVKDVAERLQAISRLQHAVDRQIALLAERREALITAAVTGRIDVTTARGVAE